MTMISERELAAFRVVDAGSLMWWVEMGPPEAMRLALALDGFNEASPERLAGLMAALNAAIPATDVGAGMMVHHRYRVGREYSRCCYVRLYDFYLPKGWDWSAFESVCREAGKVARADESDWAAYDWARWRSWRFWWD